MTPLHVAVSGWLLGPPSGANRRLLAVLEHIGPRLADGERVTVLHGADYTPQRLGDRIAFRAVPIAATPTRRRVADERAGLADVLRAIGADVLDHGFLPLPRVDVPVCLLLHDLRAADGRARWPRWFARLVVRRACARAAAVVVPSAFTAARLAAAAPGAHPVVIANGTTLPPASPPPPRVGNGYLLHVGHLEPRKNLAVLLDALAAIAVAERPDLVLVGGDAGCGDELRARAGRLAIADRVRFAGVAADDEIGRLFAGARAVVVPSTYEGFGLTALDGLAHGRPTLVADAGALPEVVGDAGVILPPHDVAAWAAAIRATAGADADAQAALAARRDRAAHFAWGEAAARTLELWRRVARRLPLSGPAP